MCKKCEVRNSIKRGDIVVRTDQGACHVTKYVVLSVRDGLCGPVAVIAPADVIGRNSYKFTISVACLDKVYSKPEITQSRGYTFKAGDKGKDTRGGTYEILYVDSDPCTTHPLVVKKNGCSYILLLSRDGYSSVSGVRLLPPTVTQYVTTYLDKQNMLCSMVTYSEAEHEQLLKDLKNRGASIFDDKSYTIEKK